VKKFWEERGAVHVNMLGLWSISNPYLEWKYQKRRIDLEESLGYAPSELKGFHGSAARNILSIAENGFDAGRRAGQVFGSGEYFAKDPNVSLSYCRRESFMLICQLTLGVESKEYENQDGDHIWVPSAKYYVVSSPAQVLPLYIVHFGNPHAGLYQSRSLTQKRRTDDESALLAQLANPYRTGAAQDKSKINLCFNILETKVEACPAVWWNGDIEPFSGEVAFDSSNVKGDVPMARKIVEGKVVLVQRGGVAFATKVAYAKEAGAKALLVMLTSPDEPFVRMTAADTALHSFAAAMIRSKDGKALVEVQHELRLMLTHAERRGGEEAVPPNRPCAMTAESTDLLWIGYLNHNFSDQQLESDVKLFLRREAPRIVDPRVRIVRGKFTQAKVVLVESLARDAVHELCTKPFSECGRERFVTVDDAHGSQDQRCHRNIAKYCRGQNLRFVDPCWCAHSRLPTERATFTLQSIELGSAKGDEISGAFFKSTPFHDGSPQITAIKAVSNTQLERQHEHFRQYLTKKNGIAPRQLELYHGTNMNILDTVYTHGLFPPSDMEASEDCPVSGGKGLRTSLCNNDCSYCTKPHQWDRCHMFGLGIYLADIAQKSHRYVSAAPLDPSGRRLCKIVVCSVLMGDALEVQGHLQECDSMHCVQSLRAMDHGDLPKKINLVQAYSGKRPVQEKDLLYIKGLGSSSRPGFSVFNSEFISFHPYQCLPRYEITYVI
jgi:hypothetical protein